ncbi:MAG: hypothetical protein ACRDFB_05260 [Rhabdochlamydiaceae bacterium]
MKRLSLLGHTTAHPILAELDYSITVVAYSFYKTPTKELQIELRELFDTANKLYPWIEWEIAIDRFWLTCESLDSLQTSPTPSNYDPYKDPELWDTTRQYDVLGNPQEVHINGDK